MPQNCSVLDVAKMVERLALVKGLLAFFDFDKKKIALIVQQVWS